MKRFLSLLIALILVFGMFAVTTVAFADEGNPDGGEQESARVTFDETAFKKYVYDNRPRFIEMSTTFMLDGTYTEGEGDEAKTLVWYKDYYILHTIFPNIRYIEVKDEDILHEGDEGYDKVTWYTLTYNMNIPTIEDDNDNGEATVAEEEGKEDAKTEYQATQVITLDKKPSHEGYKFEGWKLIFTDASKVTMPELKGDFLFAEGFKFNMPETNVEVQAQWTKIKSDAEKDEQDKSDEEVALPEVYADDIVYVLYTTTGSKTDSRSDMKDWSRCKVSETFSVTTKGSWDFRFAVADGIKSAATDDFDWEDQILVTSYDNVLKAIEDKLAEPNHADTLSDEEEQDIIDKHDFTFHCYSQDTTHPEIELSESMKQKMESGLTVGTTYSISTALTIEDANSKSTPTYLVYKQVGAKVEGADKEGWLLIYDSKKREVTEGYDDCISASGVITPLEKDVTGEYVYKIVYSYVDADGFFGVDKDAEELEEYHPTMLLKVFKAPVEPGKPNAIEAWKIVLYVIAGLSAVGIVVLLCIKPKKPETADGRYNASADGEAEGNGESEQDGGKE